MTSYVEVGHARQEIASGAARNLEVSHTAPANRDRESNREWIKVSTSAATVSQGWMGDYALINSTNGTLYELNQPDSIGINLNTSTDGHSDL